MYIGIQLNYKLVILCKTIEIGILTKIQEFKTISNQNNKIDSLSMTLKLLIGLLIVI